MVVLFHTKNNSNFNFLNDKNDSKNKKCQRHNPLAFTSPYLFFICGTLFVVLSYSTKMVLILLNSPYSNHPPYFIFLLYFESLCGQMM